MKRSQVIASILIVVVVGLSFLYYKSAYEFVEDVSVPEVSVIVIDDRTKAIIDDIRRVEGMVAEMAETESVEVINNGVMAFVRSQRYGYRSTGINRLIWNNCCGSLYEETDIVLSRFEDEEKELIALVDGMELIYDSVEAIHMDFPHMVTVIDLAYTKTMETQYEEIYYDYLFSWGGDLETFIWDIQQYSNSSGIDDEDTLTLYARHLLASEEVSHFSLEDYYADIDGVNVANRMIEEELLLSEALEVYYSSSMCLERHDLFIDSFGGVDGFNEAVRAFMLYEIPLEMEDDEGYIEMLDNLSRAKDMMNRYLQDDGEDIRDELKEIGTEVFIWKVLSGGE